MALRRHRHEIETISNCVGFFALACGLSAVGHCARALSLVSSSLEPVLEFEWGGGFLMSF